MVFVCGYCSKINSTFEDLEKHLDTCNEEEVFDNVPRDILKIPSPKNTLTKPTKMLTQREEILTEKEELKKSVQKLLEIKAKKKLEKFASGLPTIKFELKMKIVDSSKAWGLPRKKPHYICTLCEFETTKVADAKSHFVNNHKDRSLQTCRFCPRNFKFKSELTKHEKKKHQSDSVKPKEVQNLKKGFGKVNKLWKSRVCQFCCKKFPTKEKRENHEAVCSGENFGFSCSICEEQFVNKMRAEKHEKLHFQRIKKKFPELLTKIQVVKAYQENPESFLGLEPRGPKFLKGKPASHKYKGNMSRTNETPNFDDSDYVES